MSSNNERTHIRIRGLNVWYGSRQVIRDISVDVPNSGITTIIGPSGCGKTTLLKSLNRLLEDTDGARVSGEVLIDGTDIFSPHVDVAELRTSMGLLLQRPSPLPMSIFDNVAFGPRVHGLRDRRLLAELVEQNLRVAGLWDEVKDRLHGPAGRLSIGQQQRLCLARALAVDPCILLGDEITSALDPRSTRNIEHQLLELKNRYTIVLVTHILRQARRLADYVLFLYLGKLIEHGPAEEIFENPRHDLTREYVKGVFS